MRMIKKIFKFTTLCQIESNFHYLMHVRDGPFDIQGGGGLGFF